MFVFKGEQFVAYFGGDGKKPGRKHDKLLARPAARMQARKEVEALPEARSMRQASYLFKSQPRYLKRVPEISS
jgi:hypothetical protein